MVEPFGCRIDTENVDGKEVVWLKEMSLEEIMEAEFLYLEEIQDSNKILREILKEMNIECKDTDRIMEWFNSPEEVKKRSKIHRYRPKFNVSDLEI